MRGTKFVIFGPQRTGSTMLVKTLARVPKFKVHDEVFVMHGKHQESDTFFAWFVDTFEKKLAKVKNDGTGADFHSLIKEFWPERMIKDFLENLYAPTKNNQLYVGFKVMYNQLSMLSHIGEYLIGEGVHRIHLLRRNPIKRAVSGYLKDARLARGFTRSQLDAFPQLSIKVKIDPEDLWKNIKSNLKHELFFTSFFRAKMRGQRYIEMYYEDLVEGGEDKEIHNLAAATLFNFLGVNKSEEPLRIPVRKQSPDDLQDCIKNLNEVMDYFSHPERREYLKWFPGG